jgi:hypothetical protein
MTRQDSVRGAAGQEGAPGDVSELLRASVSIGRKASLKAARAALEALAVNPGAPCPGMSASQAAARERLLARARQIGDGPHGIGCLAEEAAYEHWHRMFFARYLADNELLMYGDGSTPVTIGECRELAREDGAGSGWEIAGRLAAAMLPQVFRPDSPVFELEFPPELQREMESSVESLPSEIFMDTDTICDVYAAWADPLAMSADSTRARGGRRDADFLTDNCLGAWWAAKVSGRLDVRELMPGTAEALHNAGTEEELRDFFSIPGEGGLPLKHMRFVKAGGRGGGWMPAAGWPDGTQAELSGFAAIDPFCGSGRFLVSLFNRLVPMRMFLEGLSARDAADAVLRENIHGLERDARGAGLAVFALALAAWKYPKTGYRSLPELNIACSGLSAGASKEEWEDLAGDSHNLRIALGMMHGTFRDAPAIGSLMDLERSDAAAIAGWERERACLAEATAKALRQGRPGEAGRAAVAAQGLAKTEELLSRRYNLVAANLPSLPRARQDGRLRRFCARYYPKSKHDLASAAAERSMRLCSDGGDACFIIPEKFVPDLGPVRLAARLGREKTVLLIMNARERFYPDTRDGGKINCVMAGEGGSSPFLGEIERISLTELRGFKAKQIASGTLSRAVRPERPPARRMKRFWEFASVPEGWGYFGESWVGPLDGTPAGIYPNCPDEAGRAINPLRSKNPADWSFPGHPCAAAGSGALHVAAARLLGYRWPAETDSRIELQPETLAWKERCRTLGRFASEGMACVSPMPGETLLADRLLDVLAASYGERWSGGILSSLLASAGCAERNLDFWLRNKFFAQHSRLFKSRPFIWHVWDGQKDGFSALVNCHALDSRLLEALIYSCLGDWIRRMREEGPRARKRVGAAERLKKSLDLILGSMAGGAPAGIAPFLSAPPSRASGAGVLRNAVKRPN